MFCWRGGVDSVFLSLLGNFYLETMGIRLGIMKGMRVSLLILSLTVYSSAYAVTVPEAVPVVNQVMGKDVRDRKKDCADCSQAAFSPPPPSAAEKLDQTKWIHGSPNCSANQDPPMQVVQYDADTYVVRQNMCANYEAPFIYVFLGKDRVYVQDSGATSSEAQMPLKKLIREIITKREAELGKKLDLVVGHSHGHGDHTAGDSQFSGEPRTKVIGTGVQAVSQAFGISSWPNSTGELDLGGRKLKVIPIPGHSADSVAVHDPKTGLLLTGDSLYPGRLYISDFKAYKQSIARLHQFSQTTSITRIVGCHIEMKNEPKKDFPAGETYHPNERRLTLMKEHLAELHGALQSMPNPVQQAHDDFIISP